MEMYARLAEAEDPRDFEQTLQEARKRALQRPRYSRVLKLEELAREHVNDSLAVMEYRYELRRRRSWVPLGFDFRARLAERNVAKAVLQARPGTFGRP